MSSRHSLGALRAAEVDLQHTTALHWQRFLAPCVHPPSSFHSSSSSFPHAIRHATSPPAYGPAVCRKRRS